MRCIPWRTSTSGFESDLSPVEIFPLRLDGRSTFGATTRNIAGQVVTTIHTNASSPTIRFLRVGLEEHIPDGIEHRRYDQQSGNNQRTGYDQDAL